MSSFLARSTRRACWTDIGPLARRHMSTVPTKAEAPAAPVADPRHPPPVYLDRPLGIPMMPTTYRKNMKEWRNDLLDQEVRLARRQHIVTQIGRGYYEDLHKVRRYGGKTWIAPNFLIREDKALYFPDIMGTSIEVGGTKRHTSEICKGRISVIGMLSTKISEIQNEAFVGPTNEKFLSHGLYSYVQINLQENHLKSALVNMFSSSIRRATPAQLQPTFLISSQNMEYEREPMGFTNARIGYVYLVDENLKIRWAGCADALKEETEGLLKCTSMLIKRLEEHNEAKFPRQKPWTFDTLETESEAR